MFGLTREEENFLKTLKTPSKIQDFLETLKANFCAEGDTCMSSRQVLRMRKAHCVEAAILACTALRMQGFEPLVVDLTSTKKDFDHVIAVFKKDGKWGAISKSNHAVLKYREPIYKNIRELVMSFFHEYFLDNGKKTLRSYSNPVNLKRFDHLGWIVSEEDVWYIPQYLAEVKHIPILTKKQIALLRKADKIEIEAGKLMQWKKED